MQVESDIAPFKDLFMGLFFMTVGMEISFGLFLGKFKEVLGALALLVIGKVSHNPSGTLGTEAPCYIFISLCLVSAVTSLTQKTARYALQGQA